MKYLIASDIHGSIDSAERLIEKFLANKCDKIILLGDILYHGPRNELPRYYQPKQVITLLNQYQDKIIAVKGNCDAEVDQMVLSFKINNEHTINFNNKKILLTHGHKVNYKMPTNKNVDFIIHGHTHIIKVDTVEGKTYINLGSITIPKENTKICYGILENNMFSIYSIDDNEILKVKL